MKRINTFTLPIPFSFFLSLAVGILFFLGGTEVTAEEDGFTLSVKKVNTQYVVNAMVPQFSREDFFTTVNQGMRSQITYILRLYRETEGVFSIFGDSLLWEKEITLEAGWDNLNNTYFINFPWGERGEYETEQEAAEDFFQLKGYSVHMDLSEERSFYLAGRAEFILVKLVPPMNIISFFLRGNRKVTDWIRIEMEE